MCLSSSLIPLAIRHGHHSWAAGIPTSAMTSLCMRVVAVAVALAVAVSVYITGYTYSLTEFEGLANPTNNQVAFLLLVDSAGLAVGRNALYMAGSVAGGALNGVSPAGSQDAFIMTIEYPAPTSQRSSQPSAQPSQQPTARPSTQPSSRPSSQPSHQPTGLPSSQPSSCPSTQPSSVPTMQPPSAPSI